MPPKLKTAAEKQQLKTLIIDAARELFVNKGVESVTMREIAKRIGYSATSIYSYFADKETLIREIIDTDFLSLAVTLKDILAIEDEVERLNAFGAGYARFALTHPNHYRMMFMTKREQCHHDDSRVEKNSAEQDAYYQLKYVVNAAYEAGRFKPEINDPEMVAQTLWAGMHGVCSLQITMAQDTWIDWRDIDARLTMMQQIMAKGLMKEEQ